MYQRHIKALAFTVMHCTLKSCSTMCNWL